MPEWFIELGHLPRLKREVGGGGTFYVHAHTHMQAHTHATTHACMHVCAHTHTHTHRIVYQGNGTEEKVFKKRKVFKKII